MAMWARTTIGSIGMVCLLAACASTASPTGSVFLPPARTETTAPEAAAPSQAIASQAPIASQGAIAIPRLAATFVSPRMAYSVRYPADWTTSPATKEWLPDSPNFWDDPVGDRLEGRSVGFRGTSQALPAGESAEAWMRTYLESGPNCGDVVQVPVGGRSGTIDMDGCAGQGRLRGRVFDLAIVVGGRGYNFTMEGDADHAFFLAMLATVTFAR